MLALVLVVVVVSEGVCGVDDVTHRVIQWLIEARERATLGLVVARAIKGGTTPCTPPHLTPAVLFFGRHPRARSARNSRLQHASTAHIRQCVW